MAQYEKTFVAPANAGTVSKRARVTAEFGQGTPAAATFQAQNVPFIGAQRRESEASNFERLASSLGQFSSALGSFANAAQAMEKRQAKEAEKARKEAERTAKMSSGERRSQRLNKGRDPNTSLLKDNAEFSKLVLPEKQKEEDSYLFEMEQSGWKIPAGTVEVDPETGQEGEWAMIPVTPDILIQQNNAEVRRIEEELSRPEDAAKRKLAIKWTYANTEKRIKALDQFREAENFRDYYDTVKFSAGGTLKQAKALYGDNDDGVAQAFIDNSVRLAKESGLELDNKTFFTKVMPGLLKDLAPEIENDPDLARSVNSLLNGKFGPAKASMLGHKRTMVGAKAALNAGERALAKEEYDRRVGELAVGVKDVLAKGGHISDVTLPDFKINAPNKVHTFDKAKFLKGMAAERDAEILTVDGAVPKHSSPEKLTALVIDNKQTGLESPALKAIFADAGYKEGETDPARLTSAISAFKALELHNPQAIKPMFKSRPQDKLFLETTSALLDARPDLDLAGAAKLANDAVVGEGLVKFKKANGKLVKGIEGLNADEADDALTAAYATAYASDDLDENEVKATLDKIVQTKLARKPLVHGSRVELPEGENPDAGVAKMTKWLSHVGSKINVDPTKMSLKLAPATGAYFVINKETGAPAVDPNGNMVSFSYDQVDAFTKKEAEEALRLKTEEQNRKKANREARTKNMNPVDWEKNPLWKMKP
jgi:hypothetical protein